MPLQVAFFHPNLGVGGAEQLVVSAACGIKKFDIAKNVDVTIYTAHHDHGHCFPETVDGTLRVDCRGSWLPTTLFGRFHLACVLARMAWLVVSVFASRLWGRIARGEKVKFDFIVNDQVAAINPLLLPLCRRLLFYCHFPDFLLVTNRSTWLRRAYRRVLDNLESFSMSSAHTIFVNSEYTYSVFQRAFQAAHRRKKGSVKVLHPPVDLQKIRNFLVSREESDGAHSSEFEKAIRALFGKADVTSESMRRSERNYIISLNRYERKKNIGLAVKALALARAASEDLRLIIAGGFDPRCPENSEVLEELKALCDSMGLSWRAGTDEVWDRSCDVLFLFSVSDRLRFELLYEALALVYTPRNEHFGIVPCEAMALGTIPIASNSGGPRESIVDKKTGFLCADSPSAFAEATKEILRIKEQGLRAKSEAKFPGHTAFRLEKIRLAAQRRVEDEFSLESFTSALLHAGLGRDRT
eukprot:Polyplicarium_translucidae@DN3291_c0_g1_i1.p1